MTSGQDVTAFRSSVTQPIPSLRLLGSSRRDRPPSERPVPTDVRDPFRDPALLAAFAMGLKAAATDCTTMSLGRMVVSSSEVRHLSPAEVVMSAGGPEVPVVAVYVGFSGSICGHGVLMLPVADAPHLASAVLDGLTNGVSTSTADGSGLTALQRSAIEELANVAISSVLDRLGDQVGSQIHPTVPVFVFDMAGSVLDAIISDVIATDDLVLAARTTFSRDGRDVTGVLLVVPARGSSGDVGRGS